MKYVITLFILLNTTLFVNSHEHEGSNNRFGVFNITTFEKTIRTSIPYLSPVPTKVLKRRLTDYSNVSFRIHPIFKQKREHKGIDLAAPIGTEVVSTMAGKVIFAGSKASGYGIHVIIVGDEYKTLYAHLNSTCVKTGQVVSYRQKIGEVGNTGTSTGPHLHYEVHVDGVYKNPIPYIRGNVTN